MKTHQTRERMIQQGGASGRSLLLRTGSVGSRLLALTLGSGVGMACTLLAASAMAQEPAAPESSVDDELSALEAEENKATQAEATEEAEAQAPAEAPAAEAPAATPADAPAPPTPASTPAAAQQENDELDEVVVTVDRRRKNLQDYAGTAKAFSDDKLKNIGVNSVQDLGQMVPGLQIGVNDGGAQIYIRGVGSDNTTELGDPAVGVHLDGVYLPRFRGLGAAWLDVERVEVNSGPQGTVRGRNAVGGTINIVSRKPVLREYQASAEAMFGTFEQRQYQGMVNIPIGDSLAFRAAASSFTRDSTWENIGPIDQLPGAQAIDNYALKGTLRYQPTQELDIIVSGDYTLQKGTGYIGANMIGLLNNMDDGGTPNDFTDDVLDPLDPNDIDNPRRVYQRGRYPDAQTENWGVRLSATYDAGPVLFEVLGSHRFLDWRSFTGSNAGYFADSNDLAFQQWDSWSFAQQQNNDSNATIGEFRIFSPDDQPVVWSVGVFGYREQQGAFLGQVTGDPDGGFNEFNMPETNTSSLAGYGDITYSVTDDLRVFAGLRYSSESKDRFGGAWVIGANLPQNGLELCARQNAQGECVEQGLASNDIGRFGTEGFRFALGDRTNYDIPDSQSTKEDRVNFFFDGIESFGARDQAPIALCNDPEPIINSDGNQVNVPRIERNEEGNWRCVAGVRDSVPDNFLLARPQNGERKDAYFDFRTGFEYDATDDNMLYLTLSSGHKAGGFNDSLPDPTADEPDSFTTPDYGPETAYALEIGSKNMFLDRKLRLNASAFGFLYDQLQFQTIITVGEPPPLNPQTGEVAINPETNAPYPDNRSGAAARDNAADVAQAYGLDVDATYALPYGLEAEVHALFMDARFPDGTYTNDGRLGLGNINAQVDIGGYTLPRVSNYTFNYTLSQMVFSSLGQFDWVIQGQTRGEHYMTVFNGDGTRLAPQGPEWGLDPVTGEEQGVEENEQWGVIQQNLQRLDDRVPTYTVFNLGVGWRHPDGRLSIRGFVNNALNTAYATFIFSNSGNNIRWYNEPRMAGLRMRMDW